MTSTMAVPAREKNLNIVPVFSNAQISSNGNGAFDPKRVHIFLTNPALQTKMIMTLRQWCQANRFQGINVDFENLMPQDYPLMIPFLQRMKDNFDPDHRLNPGTSADLVAGTLLAALLSGVRLP